MADEQVAYVLSSGCFSDYSVVGIYTDAEQVEKLRKKLAACSEITEFRIEEFPLNQRLDIYTIYYVSITNDGSELYRTAHTNFEPCEPKEPAFTKRGKWSYPWNEREIQRKNRHKITAESTRDYDHALKSARDYLAMLKERGDIPV